MLPCIPNLVSTGVEFAEPWTFQGSIPDNVRGKDNKKHRSAWIESPDTHHNCYSGWEGLSAAMRISKAKDGNPPYKLHALVADYDAPADDAELVKGCERLGDYTPAYFERTLSGYSRFVWLLQEPVLVPSREFAVALLKFLKKQIRPQLLSVGLDEPAWLAPERYYTNACEWKVVSDYRIPKDLMTGWIMQVAEEFSFKKTGESIAIPLEIVAEELKKRYPNFTWSGDFVKESQGPSFWIEGSTSPKSAILKAEGLYTFAAHATKPWWSWKDLLGAQFVEAYETKSLGQAVDGIFYDGKAYWRQNGPGKWCPYNKEDTAMHLHIARGLSMAKPAGGSSDVDRALEHIRHWSSVLGAAPFVFRPSGVQTLVGDQRVLNTFTRHAVSPAEQPVVWGPEGPFPWLSNYIGGFFDPAEQLDYFLAWLQRFYSSALELKLEAGQNVFIAGDTGIGKTLLSTQVIARMIGGHAAAENYLMGKTDFNSQLFESALWTVDDTAANDDVQAHRKFSTIVKRMAANTTFEYHMKFQVPCQVTWRGRVVVTCNTDEESIRIIPDLDISILDKIMIFRADSRKLAFPPSRELEATIERELPYFARWLLDWTPPAHVIGTARYGIEPYHEASLVKTSKHSSRSNAFLEILEDWKKDYFAEHTDNWQGTGYQLLVELHRDPTKASALRTLTAGVVNMQLSSLKNKGDKSIQSVEEGALRYWRILRPTRPTHKPLPVKP